MRGNQYNSAVLKVDQHRASLNEFQQLLLNEIWELYVANHEWPLTWDVHARHQKPKVIEALRPLAGSIVFESGNHQSNSRYNLKLLGILLTRDGRWYEQLILQYLNFSRNQYKNPSKGRTVKSNDVQAVLQLNDDGIKLLGRFVMVGNLFSNSAGFSSDWSSPNWEAGLLQAVEDFPLVGSLEDELVKLIENPHAGFSGKSLLQSDDSNHLAREDKQTETTQNERKVSPRIFISHSSQDSELARALVELIRAAFLITPQEIRCTSVDGHRMPTGVATDSFLQKEVITSDLLVALLTENSLKSTYVIFELGARWGVQKALFPLLAKSTKPSDLKGPLADLNARRCTERADMHQLLEDVGSELGVSLNGVATFAHALEVFVKAASITSEASQVKKENSIPHKGLTDLSARDICRAIRSAPPLKSSEFTAAYVGYTVDWEVEYADAGPSTSKGGLITIYLRPWVEEGFDTRVQCDVSLDDYPFFVNLEKDAKIQVSGLITKVGQYNINLEKVKLRLLSDQEIVGTRPTWLAHHISLEVGDEIIKQIGKKGIIEVIKSQIGYGDFRNLRLNNFGNIVPEFKRWSDVQDLFVLRISKLIFEREKPQMRERLAEIERRINHLAKYS